MKKYVFFMFLMTFTFMLAACNQSKEEKIEAYLKDRSEMHFHFSVVEFTEGELNIEITLLPIFEEMNNNAAESNLNLDAKNALEAIKSYSKKKMGEIKEVNLYFVTRETKKLAAEINVNNDTLLEADWKDVSKREFSRSVNNYKFYGVSN